MSADTKPRRTQAERSATTRLALLDAAVDTIIEEGYANLSTRRVAERAGVAQSTQMHHFPTREAFLVDALRHVARRMAEEALTELDLVSLREPERRSAILDQAWRTGTRLYVGHNMRHMPVEGGIDITGFLQALQKIGYTGGVSPEPLGRIPMDMTTEDAAKLGYDTTLAVMKKAGVI